MEETIWDIYGFLSILPRHYSENPAYTYYKVLHRDYKENE